MLPSVSACLPFLRRFSLALAFAAAGSGCAHLESPENAARTRIESTGPAVRFAGVHPGIRLQQPEFLTYAELVQLSRDPVPSPAVREKLDRFWRSPIVSNEAWFAGRRPHPASTGLGPILRVASWNIEKSLTIREVAEALTSPAAYEAAVDPRKAPPGSRKRAEILRQRARLASADILFLQEMDIGVSRSDYVDAARTLARALHMNYAYAPQALEVDPVLLGLEKPEKPPARPLRIEPGKYKGVFGSAILSRYPILHAEAFQLKHRPYDWYAGEKQPHDFVESGRRLGSSVLFENQITRELKIGGRCYFRVDIAVPQVPGGRVSLVNNHLEIKTRPREREAQIEEILGYLKAIPNPVVMAGDFNCAPDDLSSTSALRLIWRQLDNPTDFVQTASTISGLVTGTVVPLYRERGILNAIKNFQSPLAPDIPFIFPNAVRGLFTRIEKYHFDDGTTFDFRGNAARSINGRSSLLANSNEKALKGQETTFSVQRPIGPFGRYRLDWFFVRSGLLKTPTDKHAPYRFAPHFGETLAEFNDSLKTKLSDHRPIVIDLPLTEPDEQG